MTPLEVLAAAGIKPPRPCQITRDENGCAIWPFALHDGYGQCYLKRQPGKPRRPGIVHRVVYAAIKGPIPAGWDIDHVWKKGCRSRACFWPSHLEAVTEAENNRRMGEAIRERRPRPCGHSWDDTRPGRSDCAVCHREREAARWVPKSHRLYEQGRETRSVVLELLAAGLTPMDVALRAGVSRSRVYGIRRAATNNNLSAEC